MRTDDFIIISVESRKGGVGKTTIALNLASLLKKDYHVLILDVDVTGTSINAIQDASIWEESVRLLKNSKGETINLLQFFKKKYLIGDYDMRFSLESNKRGPIQVFSDYINVISSELYGPDGSLLYDPAIIFDEIHDFWLVDMIQRIAKSFSQVFDDKGSVIILDNSPGYVGLGKSIHDFLTDIGPKRGKFLSVSSLDCQDIDSCLKAIYNIHSMVCGKVEGANCYHDKGASLSALKEGVESATFNRLAIGDESLKYYSSGTITKPQLDSYQGILFNKVPITVKNGQYVYHFDGFNNEYLKDTYVALCGDDPRPYMIPFDQSIHYQFFRRNIESVESLLDEDSFLSIQKFLRRLKSTAIKVYDDPDLKKLPSRIGYIGFNMSDLSRLLAELNQVDFSNHIMEVWSPRNIFKEMYRSLQKMGLIPSFKNYSFPIIQRRINILAQHPWDSYFKDIRLLDAEKYTVAYLEYYLNVNEVDKEKMLGTVSMIIQWLLHERKDNTITREDLTNFVIYHRNASPSDEVDFQIAFVEAILRVYDLPEDISFICDALSRYFGVDSASSFSTANDIIFIADKKILTKEISSAEAINNLDNSILESAYMDVVRKSLLPIIQKWDLRYEV